MKYLKGIVFVFGVMLLGGSFKLESGGDSVFGAFICYGFFALSLIVAWSEIRCFFLDLVKK